MPIDQDQNQMKRVFIVGCARSGTTLLQSSLLSLEAVFSLPESQFFSMLIGMRRERMLGIQGDSLKNKLGSNMRKMLLRFGIVLPDNSSVALNSLLRIVDQNAANDLKAMCQKKSIFASKNIIKFQNMLDSLAQRHGSTCWIEKSPNHIYYIEEIESYVDKPNFIHIVRPGTDVVASLVDAARKYNSGHDFSENIEECIKRWNRAFEITCSCAGRPNHIIVLFSDLIATHQQVLDKIFQFLGLDKNCLSSRQNDEKFTAITQKNERWKSGVKEGMNKKTEKKFFSVFNRKQQGEIINLLHDYNQLHKKLTALKG